MRYLGRGQLEPICGEVQIVEIIAADPMKEDAFGLRVVGESGERSVVLGLFRTFV